MGYFWASTSSSLCHYSTQQQSFWPTRSSWKAFSISIWRLQTNIATSISHWDGDTSQIWSFAFCKLRDLIERSGKSLEDFKFPQPQFRQSQRRPSFYSLTIKLGSRITRTNLQDWIWQCEYPTERDFGCHCAHWCWWSVKLCLLMISVHRCDALDGDAETPMADQTLRNLSNGKIRVIIDYILRFPKVNMLRYYY